MRYDIALDVDSGEILTILDTFDCDGRYGAILTGKPIGGCRFRTAIIKGNLATAIFCHPTYDCAKREIDRIDSKGILLVC